MSKPSYACSRLPAHRSLPTGHRYNPASTWLSGVSFLNFLLWVWARSSLKVIGCCW
jgi:hypothetical protein